MRDATPDNEGSSTYWMIVYSFFVMLMQEGEKEIKEEGVKDNKLVAN